MLKMDKIPRACGCKGFRTCLRCEEEYGVDKKNYYEIYKNQESYVYCPECNKLCKGWHIDDIINEHPNHTNVLDIELTGIYLQLNFLTVDDESDLINGIDGMSWHSSQSGRRKQNFGPKTNFKKMKLSCGQFCGFPKFSKFIQEKFLTVPILENFQTIEQCSLEYDPGKGASIDPHIDDCWIWGERVVSVNLLSDSVLTISSYTGDLNRYNLPIMKNYENQLIKPLLNNDIKNRLKSIVIRIPMPRRSLLVLYGPVRYQFEHCVLREDIQKRRICLAYREFTPMYLENGCNFMEGQLVIDKAKEFYNHLEKCC